MKSPKTIRERFPTADLPPSDRRFPPPWSCEEHSAEPQVSWQRMTASHCRRITTSPHGRGHHPLQKLACAHLNPSDHVYCAKQYIAWRKACDAVMPSSQFATFLLCYVDGEAIEQEDDKCFGVARCHGFSDSMNDPTTHEKYSGDKAALKPLF
jgi:hypothetical protein